MYESCKGFGTLIMRRWQYIIVIMHALGGKGTYSMLYNIVSCILHCEGHPKAENLFYRSLPSGRSPRSMTSSSSLFLTSCSALSC